MSFRTSLVILHLPCTRKGDMLWLKMKKVREENSVMLERSEQSKEPPPVMMVVKVTRTVKRNFTIKGMNNSNEYQKYPCAQIPMTTKSI
ncbi:hypothetical protein Pmani_023146 [Petrolisthes manimaculis]|uniref:Uncharacterized protein n=1 Tax=Petrolisthes manimaculis TaxID=1843537 RepID=A0AAE1PAH7_9EUCA|nr:hypothetical protein Pmani_023146 [Petrolisthes manimaculis]